MPRQERERGSKEARVVLAEKVLCVVIKWGGHPQNFLLGDSRRWLKKPGTYHLCQDGDTPIELQVLAWTSLGCWGHLESKASEGRPLATLQRKCK